MASFKRMNNHGHFTIAFRYFEYTYITFPQLVMVNEAQPASRKHACTTSDNLQIVYPYAAFLRMAECDELIFMWKVSDSVILAEDLVR
jgi:hypothetical protein